MSRLLGSRHQLQSCLRQRELAGAARKLIKQRLRIDADIARRREHTGVPCHSAHPACCRVLHRAPQQIVEVGILTRIASVFLIPRRRRDARQKTGVPTTCRTIGRGAPCWRGSPGNRRASDRVRSTCLGYRKIAGLLHAKRRKHIPLHVDVFWLAGDLLDQRAKQNEVDVGVRKASPGPDASGVVNAR